MSDEHWHDLLGEFLRSKGHSAEEVEKILAHVERYDVQTQHDSVMESIETGEFDLASIIDEALGRRE